MIVCPFCRCPYQGYRIVGLMAADSRQVEWLEEGLPMALLSCGECGLATLAHPDHPDVQRLPAEPPLEETAQNIRTLNVDSAEIGDKDLRERFEAGEGA